MGCVKSVKSGKLSVWPVQIAGSCWTELISSPVSCFSEVISVLAIKLHLRPDPCCQFQMIRQCHKCRFNPLSDNITNPPFVASLNYWLLWELKSNPALSSSGTFSPVLILGLPSANLVGFVRDLRICRWWVLLDVSKDRIASDSWGQSRSLW